MAEPGLEWGCRFLPHPSPPPPTSCWPPGAFIEHLLRADRLAAQKACRSQGRRVGGGARPALSPGVPQRGPALRARAPGCGTPGQTAFPWRGQGWPSAQHKASYQPLCLLPRTNLVHWPSLPPTWRGRSHPTSCMRSLRPGKRRGSTPWADSCADPSSDGYRICGSQCKIRMCAPPQKLRIARWQQPSSKPSAEPHATAGGTPVPATVATSHPPSGTLQGRPPNPAVTTWHRLLAAPSSPLPCLPLRGWDGGSTPILQKTPNARISLMQGPHPPTTGANSLLPRMEVTPLPPAPPRWPRPLPGRGMNHTALGHPHPCSLGMFQLCPFPPPRLAAPLAGPAAPTS